MARRECVLPEEDVRETFTIRVSKAEKAALAATAERAGTPITKWARAILLAAATRGTKRFLATDEVLDE